jgi:hypothetical protein
MIEKAQGKRGGQASAARASRDLRRRQLLQGMASGGGVLALGGIAGEAPRSGPGAAADGSKDDHTRLGFEATDHVRWYYARARW